MKSKSLIVCILIIITSNVCLYFFFSNKLQSLSNSLVALEKKLDKPEFSSIIIPEEGLKFRDTEGKLVAQISAYGSLALYSYEEKEKIVLDPHMMYTGEGAFYIKNKLGQVVCGLYAGDHGGNLDLSNVAGTPTAKIHSTTQGGLFWFYRDGKVVKLLPESK
jgi:hypothetical protein